MALSLLFCIIAAGCDDREVELRDDFVADSRPNIILVMAEDIGPRIGAYGDPLAVTPNIDRLANEGTRYTRAFTTAGVCSPSRAAIITGVHQNVWGAGHMRAADGGYAAAPAPPIKAFPELLRAAGYYTINDGKTDYQMGTRFGGAYGGPATPWDEGSAEDWGGRAAGQPFFAYVNLFQTHESQVWPTWMLPDGLVTLVLWPMRIWNHAHWPLQTDPARVEPPPYYPDTATVRQDLARHYNNIAAMDSAFGALLDRLDEEGLARNTIVIFMSDHGDGLPRAKRWLFDSGIHVPLIIRWPGVTEAGSQNSGLVSAVDLAPTILAMAGVARPAWLQGQVFAGPDEAPARDYVYAAGDRIDERLDRMRAVRGKRFKYIRHDRPELPYALESDFANQMPMMRELRALHEAGDLSGAPALGFRDVRDPEELFDTATDPHEIANLARDPSHAGTLGRMRLALDDWLAGHEDLGFLPESELRDRFFPAGEEPVTQPPVVTIKQGVAHLESTTPGASIEYRVADGRWMLYTGPIALANGQVIFARSQRHGWKMSECIEGRANSHP